MKVHWLVVTAIVPLVFCSTCLAENLILNPSFEENFISGVAENWTALGPGDFNQGSIIHDGQKSQMISYSGCGQGSFGPGVIYQQINNLQTGKTYLFSTWFSCYGGCIDGLFCISFAGQINYAIGIDPNGGTDPAAVSNWVIGSDTFEIMNGMWNCVNLNFSANATMATAFIKINGYVDESTAINPDCCCEISPCDPPCDPFQCNNPGPADWSMECFIDDTSIRPSEFNPQSYVSATSPVIIDINNTSEILITLLDPNLAPYEGIPGSDIEVNCSGTGNTIDGPYASTDASGQTRAWISSNIDGNKTVTVTVYGQVLAITATIDFVDPNEWYRNCQNSKLLASDGARNDFFGCSVAISGDTVIVGAWGWGELDEMYDYGAAYIFRFDGDNWVQQAKLLAADRAISDHFGGSVAISGDTAIIGADYDDGNGYMSGSAYIFRFDGNDWIQQAKLVAADGNENDYFGFSVAISGDTAVIGAPVYNAAESESGGAAYIFNFDGNDWIQRDKLIDANGAKGDHFGCSVSISGDIIVIGEYGDDDKGADFGSVCVFRFDGNDWIQQAKLFAADGCRMQMFGCSVSISGDTAVVGADGDKVHGNYTGSAYIFRFDGNDWIQKAKLLAYNGAAYDYFGDSVAISGDTVVIGTSKLMAKGAAYIFRRDGNYWIQQDKLVASDGTAYDGFGGSVAISGDTVVISASDDNDNGGGSGSAYIFKHQPGDIDGNCGVDFADLRIFAEQWLGPPGRPSADLFPEGGDDTVNFMDFAFIAENWLDSVLP